MSTPWGLTTETENEYDEDWRADLNGGFNDKLKVTKNPTFLDDWEGGVIPDEPTDIEINPDSIDTNIPLEFITIDGDGIEINVSDLILILEFESIKYEYNDEVYTATMLYEMYETGFDFLFELIPLREETNKKYLSYSADSTSDENYENEFSFDIEVDYDTIRDKLLEILDDGREFLNNISGGDGTASQTDPPEPPLNSDTVVKPEFKSEFVPLKEKFGIEDDEE